MKKQVTFKQVLFFASMANMYIDRTKGKETKLTTAIKSVQKQLIKDDVINIYNTKVSELEIDFCSTEEVTGAILRSSSGAYVYTKENQKALNKAIVKASEEKTNIYERIVNDLPPEVLNDLTEREKIAFEGIVLPEEKKEDK